MMRATPPILRHRLGTLRTVLGGIAAAWAAVVIGCSSTDPPRAALLSLDGATSEDAELDAASADAADATDAAEEEHADAASRFCVGDDLRADGGDAGLACEVSNGCMTACADVIRNYRPGVAQVALDCMSALPACASADDAVVCVDRAIALACPTTTSASYCDPLLSLCVDATGDAATAAGTFPRAGCEEFANALATHGRDSFASCVTATQPNGGCPKGVVACADAIRR